MMMCVYCALIEGNSKCMGTITRLSNNAIYHNLKLRCKQHYVDVFMEIRPAGVFVLMTGVIEVK